MFTLIAYIGFLASAIGFTVITFAAVRRVGLL